MGRNYDSKRKLTAFISTLSCFFMVSATNAQQLTLSTKYAALKIDNGYITSIKDRKTGKEYTPPGMHSPLLALEKHKENFYPVSTKVLPGGKILAITYSNGSVATVKIDQKDTYLRFQLLSLSPRNDVDNVVWGPYKTTISKYIGEIISVMRNDEFAVGILGLDDNTTSGEPRDGDMTQASYLIHSPDPVKYPLPAELKEGQRFRIGGNGSNDVAFYSHPEDYYRYMNGNGAKLEPAFGASVTMHSRDRKKPYTIFYPEFNDFPSLKAPRHMELKPVDVDYIGSSIAFYACPDSLGLKVIEQVVKKEGLPYVTRNGKWVKDPANYEIDMAWSGPHDSLASYAAQLGLKAVQDEGLGEYYVNPANPWGGTQVTLNGKKQPVTALTNKLNKEGIAYGLHTLTEFVQPFSSDVHPVPNDGLCTVMTTPIAGNITATDTIIPVKDTSYLNESGGWDQNGVNVIRIGQELIKYKTVTTTPPYILTGVQRGALKTNAQAHQSGDTLTKLQINCYSGFIPDVQLGDTYAKFYANLLHDGGMNFIDFDGFESFTYQGHGQYPFKRFLRVLFEELKQLGVPYLRVMGSCVFEGNWHYMSVCNVGGGNNMFDPVHNKWGIEGKDIRYSFNSNYFPCTFGIQSIGKDWNVQTIENLQSKSIAWDATYMLGLSQRAVENRADKQSLFKAFRTWQNARNAQVFSKSLKMEMQEEGNHYHLEQQDGNTWILYSVAADGSFGNKRILKKEKKS
ncbi:hypothetical protein FHW36_103543 [Chitinophaga polysaccharea]|uniref:Glycosyl hydrolase family 101 n=1 Tax=Chitinophaga polysaccharea TaxID=1293035 RepID=A0A561PUE6_9BACT|nr:hypothetical protein [Chitinophaga polysaccharea]TWF41739.1 hypothetical protein FHW36_103543 [Chitinophaga polysaccharea]